MDKTQMRDKRIFYFQNDRPVYKRFPNTQGLGYQSFFIFPNTQAQNPTGMGTQLDKYFQPFLHFPQLC